MSYYTQPLHGVHDGGHHMGGFGRIPTRSTTFTRGPRGNKYGTFPRGMRGFGDPPDGTGACPSGTSFNAVTGNCDTNYLTGTATNVPSPLPSGMSSGGCPSGTSFNAVTGNCDTGVTMPVSSTSTQQTSQPAPSPSPSPSPYVAPSTPPLQQASMGSSPWLIGGLAVGAIGLVYMAMHHKKKSPSYRYR